jgi:hypothetical protein
VNGQVPASAVPTASVSLRSLSASPSAESVETGNVDIGGLDEENELDSDLWEDDDGAGIPVVTL